MTAQEKYQSWLDNPRFSATTRAELEAIADQAEEIEDRFYKDLSFGTAGLRGILGAGTNRMNFYTVARAAEGYARALVKLEPGAKQQGIAISYDSRNFSAEFAELTARIFIKHGYKVYLSDELRPVPLLSFAIRERKCAGGVMVTASHNPKAYNGFKTYSKDGSQLDPEAADKVATEMEQLDDLPSLLCDLPELADAGSKLVYLSEDLDDEYREYMLSLIIDREAIERQKDLKIVYSPLHGTGLKPVTQALSALGFEQVCVVPEQAEPDGDFPTAPYPNPEDPSAMRLGIELAERENSDLLIATDPDADRLGLAVRTNTGDFKILSGNEIGILLMDYILSAKAKLAADDKQHFCICSVVSSRLPRLICKDYGVKLYECLTGFKFIAEKIRDGLAEGELFDFAFEESFGYLAGDRVRDKDAVVAAALVCEMAAVAKDQGVSLFERCQELYKKYNFAAEKTVSFTREGKQGLAAIRQAMKVVREKQFELFNDLNPVQVEDYQVPQVHYFESGENKPLEVNQSNLLIYSLGGLDWFATRPSGTEPKLKVYMGAYRDDPAQAEAALAEIEAKVVQTIEDLLDA